MKQILEQFNKLDPNEQLYLLEILLLEGIKSARELYLNNFGEETFKNLVEIDPSNTKKYLEWLCKQYGNLIDIGRLERVIKDFHNKVSRGLIKHTDINYYKHIDELEDILDKLPDKLEKKEEKYKVIPHTEANVILDNDDYFIVEPLTWKASKIYGKGTKWCTSAEDEKESWINYIGGNKARIFYVRDKKYKYKGVNSHPKYKIAIYVQKHVCYDKNENIDYKKVPCTLWDAEDNETKSNLEEVSKRFGIDVNKIENIKYIKISTKIGIKEWLNFMEIEKYIINDDLTVDIDGDVWIDNKDLSKIPVQFGRVKGDFVCRHNNLNSLDGHPQKCRNFDCRYTNLYKGYLSNYDFSFVKGKLITNYAVINDKWNK